MELWTEIRRRVLCGELSKRAACRDYDLHWDTLKKILEYVEPPGYRRSAPRSRPTIEEYLPIIEEILQDDKQAPKKQRHTAVRIFERLRDDHEYTGSYSTVKTAVRELKAAKKEVFLPLSHPPGEGQVDYGFAEVIVAGEAMKVALFVMTLPYSDALFIQAFPRECTESFLEGHKRAFAFFGGVPKRISYDNAKVAVAKIVGNRKREVTREFSRLMSHYLFASHFCLVRRPQEKGHVERLLDFARSRYLVPVPRVESLAQLNTELQERCEADLQRQLRGKASTKRQLLQAERMSMLSLPVQEFDARRVTQAAANSLSLVRFDANSYSVPVKYAHRKITVVATVDEVRLIFAEKLIARHARHWGREQYFFEPVHYLALLERKPGGFDYARPLENWELPECFEVLRRRLEREPTGLGTREFIRVLRLLEQATVDELSGAVEYALDIDITDAQSIRVILEHRRESQVALFSLDGRPHLKTVRVESTDPASYQSLLAVAQGGAS